MKQGDDGDELLIIRSGEVTVQVSKDYVSETVETLHPQADLSSKWLCKLLLWLPLPLSAFCRLEGVLGCMHWDESVRVSYMCLYIYIYIYRDIHIYICIYIYIYIWTDWPVTLYAGVEYRCKATN